MRVLYIAPAEAGDHFAVPSLRFLPHTLDRTSPDMSALVQNQDPDVAVLDATMDLSLAPIMRERLDTLGIATPLLIALTEGGFTAASADWRANDIFVATAAPAEIDARLRMAVSSGPVQPAGGAAEAAPAADEADEDDDPAGTAVGPLHIDPESYTATVKGVPVALTFKEFELLRFLAANPERVFTRAQLLQDVWGSDYFGGTRTVDVHVRRLRAKLGPELDTAIHTVRNVGYRFSARTLEQLPEEGRGETPGEEPTAG